MMKYAYNNYYKYYKSYIGGVPISQNLFSKAVEIAKTRANLVQSLIHAAISTLKVKTDI